MADEYPPLYDPGRISMRPLAMTDRNFILELVNTAGWLQFIGDRQVRSPEAASKYIAAIIDNPDIAYQVISLAGKDIPIGIVTFIKKDYLPHYDIGFAILPAFGGMGYAYEASRAFLQDLAKTRSHTKILATTLPGNSRSIRLLNKLGFDFDSEITIENKTLQVYALLTERITHPG